MALLELLIAAAKDRAVDWLRAELEAPDRWEADPRTRTIRRRRRRRRHARAGQRQEDGTVIEMCPRCLAALHTHKGGRCPSD